MEKSIIKDDWIKDGWMMKYIGPGGDVVIPDGVEHICFKAFYACSGLTSATIPKGVTTIGDLAFCGCPKLTEITIPGSVIKIGKWAFGDCPRLTSIKYNGTIAEWKKIEREPNSFKSWNRIFYTIHCTDGDTEISQF